MTPPAGEHPSVAPIRIDLADPDAMELWRTVAKIAASLGRDHRWCLVGGLMVALFAIEARQNQRATTDIDVLADARARPSGTTWATGHLTALGATPREPDAFGRDHGFRFELDGQIVDVLAPDGLGPDGASTIGKLRTIQIPGGTQALNRIEVVEIVVDEEAVALRRPTLIAAILLKARSLRVHSRPDDQRHDLITLLSLLDDPRTARAEITTKEIGWVRSISDRLSINDPMLQESFQASHLRAARAAYRVLAGDPADAPEPVPRHSRSRLAHQTGSIPAGCTTRCYRSTAPAADCRCRCKGAHHGKGADSVPAADPDGSVVDGRPPGR